MAEKKKKKSSNSKYKTSIRGIAVLLILIICFLGIKTLQYRNKAKIYDDQAAQISEQIADAQSEQNEIKEERDYRNSRQFIEDQARELFNLIFDNEILFQKK